MTCEHVYPVAHLEQTSAAFRNALITLQIHEFMRIANQIPTHQKVTLEYFFEVIISEIQNLK